MAEQRQRLEAVITASSQGFVDALKQASAAVNDSTASWKDRFTKARGDLLTMKAAVDNLKSAAKEMGELGLNADPEMGAKLEENLQRMRDALGTTGKDIRTVMDGINDLKNAAHSLNLPVDEYQRLSDAAKDAGVGMASAEGMLSSMRDRIEDFMNGVPEAVDLFNRLGVSIEDVGSRSGMTNFVNIADAVKEIVSPTEQATTASTMFGNSVDDVNRILAEYKRSLMDRKDSEFITDRDVQQAIAYRTEIEALEKRMDPLGQKIETVVDAVSKASFEMTGLQKTFKYAKEAYDAYLESLEKSERKILNVGDALKEFKKGVLSVRDSLAEALNGESSGSSGENVQKSIEKYQSLVEFFKDMRSRIIKEMEIIDDHYSKTLASIRSGSEDLSNTTFDYSGIKEAQRHIASFYGSILKLVQFIHEQNSNGMKIQVDLSELENTRRMLDDFDERYDRMINVALPTNFTSQFSSLLGDVDKLGKRLDEISQKEVKIRPAADSREFKEINKELEDITRKIGDFREMYSIMERISRHRIRVDDGWTSAIDLSKLGEARSMLERINTDFRMMSGTYDQLKRDQEKLNEERRVGINLIEKMWNGMKSAVNAFGNTLEAAVTHPTQLLKDGWNGICDAVKRAWSYAIHFKLTSSEAGDTLKDQVRALGRLVGMLFGVRSLNMVILMGVRKIGEAAKEVAMWWLEAAKRQAEFKAGLATDATNQFKENRKEAEDRMNLSKRYAEAVGKANVSGKREDEAEADAIRRQLWEKHGVEANRDNARSVFKEMSESYYDTRVSQNEAETAMYKELAGNWRKALEERKSYLVSVFGMRTDLSQKIGEDTVYTDLVKKLGEAQKRLGELAKERSVLQRTQRGGEYADFAAIRGGRNTDAWRERIKKQREKSDKTIDKRRKDAEKADAEIDSWLDELDTLDEEERKVVKANEKYAKLVRDGGDKRKAREALDLEVSKIREEASKKDAEAVNKLAEQHERQLERLKDADRKELDARRKMEEAERDLADATRRAKDDVRLKRIGREKERIKDRMGEFGFSVPKNLKTGLTGKERAEIRRNAKIDASIGKKLEQEKKGRRVTYTPRERRRLDEYRGLERKLKGLEAEEKQMKAAQTEERAANTMQNATDKFQEAVRAFYKAQTGKDLESKKEQRARERKEKRQREKAKKDDMRRRAGMRPSGGDGRPTGGDGSGRPPRGQAPAPSPRPAPAPKPAPAPERREEPQASRSPAKFLEFSDFLERFVGDAKNAERYYRKYVEAYNRTYGTENEADMPRRTEEYPPTEIERKLPPEYENATRDQKNRAMWNRRARSQDYDDEGRWRHSPEAWRVRVDESREDAEKWGRETGWMPGAMTQRDFERVVAGLYAPPRFTEAGNADQHDYTALLERIATAIEHGDKNVFTVK